MNVYSFKAPAFSSQLLIYMIIFIYMILLNKKQQWLDLLRIFSYVLLPPNTLTSAKKQSNRLSKNVPLLMCHVLFFCSPPPCQLMYHVKFLWVQTELILLWSSVWKHYFYMCGLPLRCCFFLIKKTPHFKWCFCLFHSCPVMFISLPPSP